MEKMIAYCGLDCAACEARIATVQDDSALRRKFAAEDQAVESPVAQ